TEHQTVQLGLAVVCRYREWNRWLPPARDELGDIHVSELHHDTASRITQHDRWRYVRLGIGIDEEPSIRRHLDRMIAALGRQLLPSLSVQPDAIVVSEVRIFRRVAAERTDDERAPLLVHVCDLRHRTVASRDLVDELAGIEI